MELIPLETSAIDPDDLSAANARCYLALGRLDGALAHAPQKVAALFALMLVRRTLARSLTAAGYLFTDATFAAWLARVGGPPPGGPAPRRQRPPLPLPCSPSCAPPDGLCWLRRRTCSGVRHRILAAVMTACRERRRGRKGRGARTAATSTYRSTRRAPCCSMRRHYQTARRRATVRSGGHAGQGASALRADRTRQRACRDRLRICLRTAGKAAGAGVGARARGGVDVE